MKHDIYSPNIKASTETNIEANTQTNIDEARITEDAESLLPPAVTLPLTGHHLIEASAGTGKTWTLTGVMLRLIVQAGQPCEKIIATTFTRSAAAEMRQRIRERLQDFYQL
ncbi:MAG: UvrD-helicase domain-containing protein, partial [Ignavibacteria bacterium]